MTDKKFSYENHIETLKNLIKIVKEHIQPYKQLLLDFVSLKTDLSDFQIENIEKLPAVKWKLRNLNYLKENNPYKFKEQYDKLKDILGC